MKQKTKEVIAKVIDVTGAIIYFPMYFVGWVLHLVARLILAIAYTLMLDYQKATDIITNFGNRGRKH